MKARNATWTWWLNLPSLVWLLLFFAVPTLILFLISFKPAGLYGGVEPGWTIQAWENSMSGPGFRIMLWRTLYLTIGATLICLALAVPCSWYMVNQPPHRRSLLMLLVMVPFGTSFLVRILAWKVLLHPEGYFLNLLTALGVVPEGTMLLYRESAVLMVLVYAYLPFAILPVYAVAEKFDFTLMDAARDLGASKTSALIKVFLPALKPGLITAMLMVMVPVLGSYVIPDLVGGPSDEMLGNKIAQRSFADRNLPQAAALASALTILVLVPMLAHIWRRPNTSSQVGS